MTNEAPSQTESVKMCKAAPCPWQPGSAQCAMFRIGKCKGSGGARIVHRDLQSANPADLCLRPQNDKHGFFQHTFKREDKVGWCNFLNIHK